MCQTWYKHLLLGKSGITLEYPTPPNLNRNHNPNPNPNPNHNPNHNPNPNPN